MKIHSTYIVWLLAGLIWLSLSSAPALAHVTLNPRETVVGRQIYDIRVPTERDVPTVGLKVLVPEDIEVTGVAPVPGWTYTVKREVSHEEETAHDHEVEEGMNAGEHEQEEGKIIEITWSGGKIQPGEYMTFPISTNYAGSPKVISWKAYQTYENGEVVAWVDAEGGTPAPKVNILAETKLDTLTNSINSAQTALSAEKQSRDTQHNSMVAKISDLERVQQSTSMLNGWIGGAALVLSAIALVVSLKRKK